MKTATIAAIAAGVLPIASFAQTPPTPPAPAAPAAPGAPAVPPAPPHGPDRDRGPKVPVTFLGVETSEVPTVLSDQLGLAKGFGLVVDYVVPDGPAAAAGVQQNDILKNLNEQILMEPDQLSKLIRSFPEGATVTLTVLRKGTETKLSAKLGKRDVPQRRGWDGHGMHGPNFGAIDFGGMNMSNFNEQMDKLREQMGNLHAGLSEQDRENIREQIRQSADAAREGARAAREGAREAAREGARAAREAQLEARRAAREMRIAQHENGAVKTTRIDMGKAQIVYHDQAGELKIENVDGKKVLTAKDPQGRLVFSGPVETKEELDKVPAEVRQRYDKLEQKDLPNVVPPNVVSRDREDSDDEAADADDDDGDNDADADDDNDTEATEAVLQVSCPSDVKQVPYRRLGINTVTI